jgi:hypothetical protein
MSTMSCYALEKPLSAPLAHRSPRRGRTWPQARVPIPTPSPNVLIRPPDHQPAVPLKATVPPVGRRHGPASVGAGGGPLSRQGRAGPAAGAGRTAAYAGLVPADGEFRLMHPAVARPGAWTAWHLDPVPGRDRAGHARPGRHRPVPPGGPLDGRPDRPATGLPNPAAC